MNSNISELWNPRPYFLDFYRVFCYILSTSLFEGIKELSRSRANNQKRAVKAGGTRMSLKRLKSVFPRKITAPLMAGMLSLGAFTQHAHAGGWDAQAATTKPTAECGLSSQEICDFDRAATDARFYAQTSPGVGIVIHVGQDIPNEHFKSADDFGQAVVNAFLSKGEKAKYFLRQNNEPATVLNYYIGPHMYGQNNKNETMNVQEALQAIPGAIEHLRFINGQAAADDITPRQ